MLEKVKRRLASTATWQRLGSGCVRLLWRDLSEECRGCRSLLDLGCGSDPQSLHLGTAATVMLGDANAPDLRQAVAKGVKGVCLNVTELPFKNKSVDGILLLQVLEHLDKPEGEELLGRLEATASKVIVISTPNGFVAQGVIGGNPYQIHKSGWSPQELRRMGYRVWGYEGLRVLRRPNEGAYRCPRRLWGLFNRLGLMESLCRRFPSLAFQLVAVKHVQQ